MRKWAYMGIPHTGGTYSVFKNLRASLLPHGVELLWIGVGAEHTRRLSDGAYNEEMSYGTVVAPEESSDRRLGAALVKFFENGDYEGVFVNVLCGRVATNFARYLAPSIPRIMIVHSISVGTYAAARGVRDYGHATAGVSPRISTDLIRSHGFDKNWTVSIPNAVEIERFEAMQHKGPSNPLRVLSLGRIEDSAKGCFLLPKIISHVQDLSANVLWQIAGDGPDLAELKRRCIGHENVEFLGRIPYEHVPQTLAQADVYIFPSRYEGFGISLVEAMAAGCVPVASAIRGVTDSIIEDGKTGYLFPNGDWRQAAERIARLVQEPASLPQLTAAARTKAREKYSIETVAQSYLSLIDNVLAHPRPLGPTLDLQNWSYPKGLRPGLRTYLPEALKTRLRVLRESIYGQTA